MDETKLRLSDPVCFHGILAQPFKVRIVFHGFDQPVSSTVSAQNSLTVLIIAVGNTLIVVHIHGISEGIRHGFCVLYRHYRQKLKHCTAGKDRCGMTAVLIEYMLGFDMEDIIADYMLTNEAAMPFADRIYAHVLQLSGNEQRAKGVWRAFVADTAYLYAAFDEMEKRCGGIDGFIENGLGIDKAGIESFREKILE